MRFNHLGIFLFSLVFSGCAVLHHVQVGEIDNRAGMVSTPFEIKVSETGVDLNDARAISKGVLGKKTGGEADKIMEIVQMFQMGPHTGAGVFSVAYADGLEKAIRSQCPNGAVTDLMMIRETRKYPVISGEIIKIKGACLAQAQTTKKK